MPTTLIAVSGMSPAILTETLWALAQETPPVVPDEVIVITTARGERDLQAQLLTPVKEWKNKSVWETLRADLLKLASLPRKSRKLQLSVRVIELRDEATGIRRKAEDLRTREDNAQAADFIVQTLAPCCDAQDTHVIASIAGGRKTMSSLLYAAMSLLGKETDRVTHVLVSEPFESCRGFFYPAQPAQSLPPPAHLKSEISNLRSSSAVIELADIPFVPLRNKFAELNERRTFAGLVDCYAKAERPLSGPPAVRLDLENAVLTVQGKAISLSGRELLTAAFLAGRARQGRPHYENALQAETDYQDFVAHFKAQHPFHKAVVRSQQKPSADDITKALSSLRQKLTKAGAQNAIPYLAPERRRVGFDIQPD